MGKVTFAPHTKELFLSIQDGEWHEAEPIIERMTALIPDDRHGKSRVVTRRELARRKITETARKGHIEFDGKRIRLASSGKLRVFRAQGKEIRHPSPSQRSIETRKLFEILADGEWRDYEEVVLEVARSVPPERGFRASMANRSQRARKHGGVPDLTRGNPWKTGQRDIAVSTIKRQVDRGAVKSEFGKICLADPENPGAVVR